jgi:hypothetical protein
MEPGYVFIVGCDRTGTTLLVNILNKHSDICISNQTHFMGHLVRPGFRQRMKEFGDLSDDDNVRRLVEFVYARPFAGGVYWHWLHKNVKPEALLHRILDSDRSERALFSLLMQVRARGETILGEKTPDHIKYVPTLLEWFPEARIVHTVRDPRAVYVSEFYHRWNQPGLKSFPYKQLRPIRPLYALFILFHMSLEWFLAANYHFKYKRQYPNNYYVLKFEDLINDPENQIRRFCAFLGVELQKGMLDQKVINTGFRSRQGKPGFDKQAIERWKEHIHPLSRAWFLLWGRKYLKEFAYID